MRFNPDNFLYLLKQIVTGVNTATVSSIGSSGASDGGIQRDVSLSLNDIVILQTGSTVKLSTVTNYTAVPAVETAAGNTSIGYISLQIPRDYDESSDRFSLRFSVITANADAGITLTGTPTVSATGIAPVSTAAVTAVIPFTTTSASLGQTEQVVEIILNGYKLVRDTVLSVALAYAGTTTGVADILGIQYKYDSTIVSFNETDTTDAPGGTLPGFGNPLR